MKPDEVQDYLAIAKAMIDGGNWFELAEVFRLRDEATAAMIRQCCLPDQPDDEEVSSWLSKIPANAYFLDIALRRTGQKIVKK